MDTVCADGNAWLDEQAVELRLDAQQGLAYGVSQLFLPSPGFSASLPATIWQKT